MTRREEQPRTRAEQKAATRERLLDAAEHLVQCDGWLGVSAEAVAAQAGLTKGALYAHFADRETMLLALLERTFGRRVEAMTDLDDLAVTDLTTLFLRTIPSGEAAGEAALKESLDLLQWASRNPKVRGFAGAVISPHVEQLVERLRQADVDQPEMAAWGIVAMGMGFQQLRMLLGDHVIPADLVKSAAEHLVRPHTDPPVPSD